MMSQQTATTTRSRLASGAQSNSLSRSRKQQIASKFNLGHRHNRMSLTLTPLLLLLFITLTPLASLAYPSGAPDQACKDMKPGHGSEPTSGTAPFELVQDKLEAGADEQIKVTLSSASKTNFKGLLVQALNEKGEPVGKFLAGKGLKTLDSCSAVTHSDRENKKTATIVWQAPADLKAKGPVSFKATVVHKFDQFYMNIKSTLASRR